MKKNVSALKHFSIILFASFIAFSGCKKEEEEETPTKVLMQGTWELTAATDSGGTDIKDKIAFPVTVIQLNSENGMTGTQSPMFMYLVYGGSKWIEASAKIKQTFDYAKVELSSGEFFVDGGTPNRFTVEAKLQASAALGSLGDILTVFGVGSGYLQQTIYHKFMDVKVTIPKQDGTKERNTMIWEFDTQTTAAYNYKDSKGNIVLWNGWPVTKFSRAKFTFTKRIKTAKDVVQEHI